MVNASPLRPLQVAIYTRLAGVLEVPVYDGRAPEADHHTSFPYVVIGEAVATPTNTHSSFGHSAVETVHVWSRMREYSEANQIVSDIVAALDRQPLSLGADWHTRGVRWDTTIAAPDPDPEIRHVLARFRVDTEYRPAA